MDVPKCASTSFLGTDYTDFTDIFDVHTLNNRVNPCLKYIMINLLFCLQGVEIKKVCHAFAFRLSFFLITFWDYSATFVESQQALTESAQQALTESAQQCFVESAQAFTESLQALAPQHSSTAAFSVWLLAALLPQEAKETATKATNKNTNFFIFFVF